MANHRRAINNVPSVYNDSRQALRMVLDVELMRVTEPVTASGTALCINEPNLEKVTSPQIFMRFQFCHKFWKALTLFFLIIVSIHYGSSGDSLPNARWR